MRTVEPDGLFFEKVSRDDEPVDVYVAYEESPAVPSEPRYACIAICRHEQHPPAIGGTRAVSGTPAEIRRMAIELARTMDDKVSLIRLAERGLGRVGASLFEWRGGKGIILLPEGRSAPSPRMLLAYGRLVEHLRGEFFASIDVNVGRAQLRWLERATSFIVGTEAGRQTSEATAIGVSAAIFATLGALNIPADRLRRPLGNVEVALFGLGKVGFSLLRMLYDEGAAIRIWEPRLRDGCDAHFNRALNDGAQIGERAREILISLEKQEKLFGSEEEALASAFAGGSRSGDDRRPIRIVCTAADTPRWLISNVGGKPRYEHLADATHEGPMLIIGATNDQFGAGREDPEVLRALEALSAKGILFVPDPIVSPGGVISVSWELAAAWDSEGVRHDTREIVQRNVRTLFERAGGSAATALTIDRAFREMLEEARRL